MSIPFESFPLPLTEKLHLLNNPLQFTPNEQTHDDRPVLHDCREKWLEAFVSTMRPHLQNLGFILPDAIRVSIGFPSRGAMGQKKKLYQVFPYECSKDGTVEIFISPLVSDPLEALVSLTGALGYAAVGVNDKEGFKRYCEALGLGGKPNTLYAGDELKSFLVKKLDTLGAFPGATLDPTKTMKDAAEKKAGTRMLKAQCEAPDCGYTIRLALKWVQRGLPQCVCGMNFIGPVLDADGEPVEATK